MTFTRAQVGAHQRDEGAFLNGTGLYVDDMRLDRQVHGFVVRSPHAHARICAVDASRARCGAGVLAVLTAADVAGLVNPLGCVMPLKSEDGTPRAEADRAVLAADRVRHVGDPVAFVVAETLSQATDAAALVSVDYDVLPAIVEPGEATFPIWPDAPDNVCFRWRFGDVAACRRLFDQAAHVTRLFLRNPRYVAAAIEPRAAIGSYDPAGDQYTLAANTQGVHFVRRVLAKALGIAEQKLRVVTPDVGGGFGSKIFAYPEHALVLLAARAVGRPVRWTATRSEAFLSDTQARDHHTEAALALDENARFLALSVKATVNLGAYLSQYAPLTATGVGAPVQAGAYRFQAIDISVRGVFTNTVPVDAFRGAGRPEATYVLERIIDRAAAALGMDAADLRAANLPEAQAQTLVAVSGLEIDGGQFLDNQRRCLALADRDGFAQRRADSAKRGRLRGFGFANYLESNGGLAVAKMIESDQLPIEAAALKFGADGTLEITIGTQSTGQDHAWPMVSLAAERFGLDPDDIVVRQGDTGSLGRGGGTGGSKSLLTSSVALEQAIADVDAKARTLLAARWNASADKIVFEPGRFVLPGSNRSISVRQLVDAYPGALDGESHGVLKHGSCANGCHACEVEIDPETGETRVLRYTAVDDFGRVVNEVAVRGQVQGGVAHGIGQALLEAAEYDRDTGQLVTGSLLDYAVPRANDVPCVDWTDNGLVSRTNVFGAKACGEAGASAAPPAVMNAIVNALAAYPSSHELQMPARAVEVRRIIDAAR